MFCITIVKPSKSEIHRLINYSEIGTVSPSSSQTLFKSYSLMVPIVCFIMKGSSLQSGTAFSCCVSVSVSLEQMWFFMIKPDYVCILGWNTTVVVPCFLPCLLSGMIFICPITDDAHFDDLIKVVPARIPFWSYS